MNGYAHIYETLKQDTSLVFYSIDSDYYNEKKMSKYSMYFVNELMDLPAKAKRKEHIGSIFFFEYWKFVKACRELPTE